MRRLDIRESLTPAELLEVTALLDAAEDATGHRSIGPQRLQAMTGGAKGATGILSRTSETGLPAAYAQVTRVDDGPGHDKPAWVLDLVTDPSRADEAVAIGGEVLRAAMDLVGRRGGGTVQWWVRQPTPVHDAVADALGLKPTRDLCQLRRTLPLEGSRDPEPLVLRAFRPGHDEEAWLAVNNRAFHWHPEQGGWDRSTLEGRKREPWFDPEGFLLHERDGRLAGFCWTKIHPDDDPPLGEIYVVGVDPDCRRLGLGRSLVVAGLDWLAGRGLGVGMLWVDLSNEAALRLYRSMGFTMHHLDRAYTGEVLAGGSSDTLDPDR